MKLVIQKPQPVLGGKVKLIVVEGTDKIALWEKPTKETRVVLKKGAVDFPVAALPKTLWLEVLQPSKKLQDIELEIQYSGATDTVKATGVWVEFKGTLHDKGDKLWKETSKITADFVRDFGGIGLVPLSRKYGIRNLIVFRFRALPVGVGTKSTNTEFVRFDNARQAEGKIWLKQGGRVKEIGSRTFPVVDDEVNDDKYDDGESNIPNTQGHLFAVDAPGRTHVAIADLLMWRANFREFYRIRFDGTKPVGGTGAIRRTDGSRCSRKIDWYMRHTWKRVGLLFERTTGNDKESDENDIGRGHKVIGTGP